MSPHNRVFILLTLGTAACGQAFTSGTPDALNPSPIATVNVVPTPDPVADGGNPEAAPKLGFINPTSPDDSDDAGQDAESESESDSAPDAAVTDSSPDNDAVVVDAAGIVDASDADVVDAASSDAAVADAALVDADAAVADAAVDAAPPPPECVQEGLTVCGKDGVSPLVCHNQKLISNGGACAFGCNEQTGACNCAAPSSRFQSTTYGVVNVVEDTITGRYFANGGNGSGVSLSGSQLVCGSVGWGFSVATVDVLQGILSEASPSNECAPNFDAKLIAAFGLTGKSAITFISTPDTCTLPDSTQGYVSVVIASGEVICGQPEAFVCVK